MPLPPMRVNRSRQLLQRAMPTGEAFRGQRQGGVEKPPGSQTSVGQAPRAQTPQARQGNMSMPNQRQQTPTGQTLPSSPSVFGSPRPGGGMVGGPIGGGMRPQAPLRPSPFVPGSGRPGGNAEYAPIERVEAERPGRSINSIYDAPGAFGGQSPYGNNLGSGVGIQTTMRRPIEQLPTAQPEGAARRFLDAFGGSGNFGGYGAFDTQASIPQIEQDSSSIYGQLGPFNGGAAGGAPTNTAQTQSAGRPANFGGEGDYDEEGNPIAQEEDDTSSGFATSSQGLSSEPPPPPPDPGQAANQSAQDSAGDDDYAGAVYDANGNRVDPVTGARIDGEGNPTSEQGGRTEHGQSRFDGSVDSSGYSSDDQEWIDYLRANGYDVTSGTDSEGNPEIQIRGDDGRGDSGSYHGHFGNADDWTDQVRALRAKFDEENRGRDQQRAAEERSRRVAELLDMMPDAPQIGQEETDEMIRAQQQLSAFEAARGNRAAMAMMARGRGGVGAMAGQMADSSNQLAAQQGRMAAELKFRVKMANFESQRQQFASQISMLQQFIANENDVAAREMAQQHLQEIIRMKAGIDKQMMEEQQAAQNESTFWNTLGGFVGDAGGVALNLGASALGFSGGSPSSRGGGLGMMTPGADVSGRYGTQGALNPRRGVDATDDQWIIDQGVPVY